MQSDPALNAEQARLKTATTLSFKAVAAGSEAEVQPDYLTNHCEILNQSASGLAVRKTPDSKPLVAVGEIIGVKLPDKDAWNIGAARWVQSNDAQEIELGIQLLAPNGIPLFIEAASGSMVRKHEALLLPSMEALRQTAVISRRAIRIEKAAEYKLEHKDRIDRIKATRLVEQTTHFELFQFVAA